MFVVSLILVIKRDCYYSVYYQSSSRLNIDIYCVVRFRVFIRFVMNIYDLIGMYVVTWVLKKYILSFGFYIFLISCLTASAIRNGFYYR